MYYIGVWSQITKQEVSRKLTIRPSSGLSLWQAAFEKLSKFDFDLNVVALENNLLQ